MGLTEVGVAVAPFGDRRQDAVCNGLIAQGYEMIVGVAQCDQVVCRAFGHGPLHACLGQGRGHRHHDVVEPLGIEIRATGPGVGFAQNPAQHKHALLRRRLEGRTAAQVDDARPPAAHMFLHIGPGFGT